MGRHDRASAYSRAHTLDLDRLIDTVRETQVQFHGERYWERTEEESS